MPGAPIKSTPRGIRAPISRNLFGFFKNSTISRSSSFASSTPATSLNVVRCLTLSGAIIRARDWPKPSACTLDRCTCRPINQMNPRIKMMVMIVGSNAPSQKRNPEGFFSTWVNESNFSFGTPKFVRVSVRDDCSSFFEI